jgi:hypothetical protein
MQTNLFARVDVDVYAAIGTIAANTGLDKRVVVEATIAQLAGLDYEQARPVSRAWARFRRSQTRVPA